VSASGARYHTAQVILPPNLRPVFILLGTGITSECLGSRLPAAPTFAVVCLPKLRMATVKYDAHIEKTSEIDESDPAIRRVLYGRHVTCQVPLSTLIYSTGT
jgi:hypothetical protein